MKNIPVRRIAASTREVSSGGRFSIRSLQQILNGKDLVHDLHRHDFFFILILEKAEGVHVIDFVPFAAHDQSIFLLRPGQVHMLELKSGSSGFLLEFDQAFYRPRDASSDQRWKKAFIRNYCKTGNEGFSKLFTFITTVFNEYTDKQEGYAEAIRAGLDLFFIEYIRQSRNPNFSVPGNNPYSQDRFEELTQLLEANIGSMKNVSQYADLLHLSPYQLNSITKASVGKTVSELINEQIILEAKRFLLATANQIKDVADHLGYEDVSYFIRFFKKHTGYSPDAFRKKFK